MPYQRICVGISGRGDEDFVIRRSAELAAALGAELTFLHVNDRNAGAVSLAFLDYGHKLDATTLEKYVQAEAGETPLGQPKFDIRTGDWLDILVEITTEFDCLSLGHHHVGSIQELFTLSKDEQIINRAKCPVLVIPSE
jgi:nucleotide-binding universal stress UspA family protein